MKIHSGTASIQGLKNAVVTSGTFGGVHIGHQKILERLKQAAKEIDGETVLITYWPHPRLVLSNRNNGLKLLSTFPEKANLLEHYGIDHLVKIPFTKEFASLSSEAYIKSILHDKVGTKKLIIGYDHRFGKDRQGGLEELTQFAPKYGYELEEIPRQDIEAIGVSSTRIRKALEASEVTVANQYLGRPYSLTGMVIHGNKLGRTIGFPTANIGIKEPYKLLPSNGIYAIRINIDFKVYDGMINIGNRPTVGGNTRTIEANIFDFDEDIYDQEITVEFIDHIRNEIKFDGIDGLKNQLQKDELACREALDF